MPRPIDFDSFQAGATFGPVNNRLDISAPADDIRQFADVFLLSLANYLEGEGNGLQTLQVEYDAEPQDDVLVRTYTVTTYRILQAAAYLPEPV